jgi:hypothetical protein
MSSASFDWRNIDQFTFNRDQLDDMKKPGQKYRFPTLNHNLVYCYNDARVIMDVRERKARLPRRCSQLQQQRG